MRKPEIHLLLLGLRAWGGRMSLETIRDECLVEALREFVLNQETELAHLVAGELRVRLGKRSREAA